MQARVEVKNLSKVDETRKFEEGHLEPVVVVDFQGFTDYAKARESTMASLSDTECDRIYWEGSGRSWTTKY